MVRFSFLVLFSQIASVLAQSSLSVPTEVPSLDSFTGSYDFYPLEDQTDSPTGSPTGSPIGSSTENGYSDRELNPGDDVSGSGSVRPSVFVTCALVITRLLL